METKSKYGRLVLLFGLLLGVCIFALGSGFIEVSYLDILKIIKWKIGHPLEGIDEIAGGGVTRNQGIAVWVLRMPRVCLAAVAGGSFSICGAVMQSIFRNPLADPFLIGTSGGAALGTILGILCFQKIGFYNVMMGEYGIPLCGFFSSLLITLLVYKASNIKGGQSASHLLLSGVAANSFLNALIGFLVFRASNEELRDFMFWSMGSLSEASWETFGIIAIFSIPMMIGLMLFSRQLNAMLLGDEESFLVGINVAKVRVCIFTMVALMMGAIVSFCGVIGFVGLAGPHLARIIVGNNHRYLLLGSILSGSILVVISDWVARVAIPESNIPIGIITSLIGAPLFLILLHKSKKQLFG